MLREVLCPPAALQGRAGAARMRTGDMDILVVASYFAPASTNKCGETAKRLLGREHQRQAWKTNHAIVDDRRKRGLRAGSKRRRKNGDLQRKCSGRHQAKIRKQRRRAFWQLRPRGTTLVAPSSLTMGDPAVSTTSRCRRRP